MFRSSKDNCFGTLQAIGKACGHIWGRCGLHPPKPPLKKLARHTGCCKLALIGKGAHYFIHKMHLQIVSCLQWENIAYKHAKLHMGALENRLTVKISTPGSMVAMYSSLSCWELCNFFLEKAFGHANVPGAYNLQCECVQGYIFCGRASRPVEPMGNPSNGYLFCI